MPTQRAQSTTATAPEHAADLVPTGAALYPAQLAEAKHRLKLEMKGVRDRDAVNWVNRTFDTRFRSRQQALRFVTRELRALGKLESEET